MLKTIAHIEGMSCGMCEAHINDTVRKTFPEASHVSASRQKKQVTFITEKPISTEVLRDAINKTGYTCLEVTSKPYEQKKGFFGRLFG
jgi:copper chaperone CopZ